MFLKDIKITKDAFYDYKYSKYFFFVILWNSIII